MTKAPTIEAARNWFAEDLRIAAPVLHTPAIITAFAKVPREHYLGQGPWRLHPRQFDRPAYVSPTNEAHHLYHDVLISIDQDLEINNGLPSLWAYYLDQMALKPGAVILQVGAGVGYFTAILAELVTDSGRVIAYEIEADLAERARENLKHYPNVEVISGDATEDATVDATVAENLPKLDAILVFAGATHVPENWVLRLAKTGRIVIPFTGDDHWGFMLRLEKRGTTFAAASLGNCGFYHCDGARKPAEAAALETAIKACGGTVPSLDQMHHGQPQSDAENVWYVGDGFWLSSL